MEGKSSSLKQTKQRDPEAIHDLRVLHAPALAHEAGRPHAHLVAPAHLVARRPRLALVLAAPPLLPEAPPTRPRPQSLSLPPLPPPANDKPRPQSPAPLHRPLPQPRKPLAGPTLDQGPDLGPDPGLDLCPPIVSAEGIYKCYASYIVSKVQVNKSWMDVAAFGRDSCLDFACFTKQTMM